MNTNDMYILYQKVLREDRKIDPTLAYMKVINRAWATNAPLSTIQNFAARKNYKPVVLACMFVTDSKVLDYTSFAIVDSLCAKREVGTLESVLKSHKWGLDGKKYGIDNPDTQLIPDELIKVVTDFIKLVGKVNFLVRMAIYADQQRDLFLSVGVKKFIELLPIRLVKKSQAKGMDYA